MRLPVPPRRHPKYRLDHWLVEWTEVDSNHRSKMQQIYSLSPLASRESVHTEVSLTIIHHNISREKTQVFFYFYAEICLYLPFTNNFRIFFYFDPAYFLWNIPQLLRMCQNIPDWSLHLSRFLLQGIPLQYVFFRFLN